MFDFFLQVFLYSSFGILIYLLSRSVPRIEDGHKGVHGADFFDRILAKLPLRKMDSWLNILFEKFLRRSKVFSMKFDNFLHSNLEKLRKDENVNNVENKIKTEILDKEEEK